MRSLEPKRLPKLLMKIGPPGGRIAASLLPLILAPLLLLGCRTETEANPGESRWFHGRLSSPQGAEVPFFLQLPLDCTLREATILNGKEQIHVPCELDGTKLRVDFPIYGTFIEARFDEEERLAGNWWRIGGNGNETISLFEAQPISSPDPRKRIPAEKEVQQPAEDRADFSGIWRMQVEPDGPARGIFEQDSSGVVTGTVEVPKKYGDLRYLAGHVEGNHLMLSTFDGQLAVRLEAYMKPGGSISGFLEGQRLFYDSWAEFGAEREDSFRIEDPLNRVHLTGGRDRLDMDLSDDPGLAGKPLILEILGTWCPNCGDVAPLLDELHSKYRADGLQILGLAFELPEYSQEVWEARVSEFKRRHDISWEVRIAEEGAGILAEGFAGLSPIEGVPVTVFLNRDGTVHAVYTGFSGPATGDAYQEGRAVFQRLAAEIVR